MNVFDLLKKDHKKVSALFSDIEELSGKEVVKKEKLFNELNLELTAHTAFEEQYLYPLIKEADKTHDLTLEAYEEHRLVKQLLSELGSMKKDIDEWDAKHTVLKELVEHHVEEEEGELFPKAKKVLSKEQIDDLTTKFKIEKDKLVVSGKTRK